VGYPLPVLYEEVAFIAYHFHWPAESILNLEHGDRRRWVQEISSINERRNGQQSNQIETQSEGGDT
jgi:hypothetical protein